MSMKFELNDGFRALVLGASGALGHAFAHYLRQHDKCLHVLELSRSAGDFDLEIPQSLEALGQRLRAEQPFQVIVDATGALTIDGAGPEKSLAKLEGDALSRAFAVNAIGPALLMRHVCPLLTSGDALYAKLSARVGSIADNRKGGWYGYRASKAALNMFLQTAAIELQRKNPLLRVVALQPGTVRSRLSEPYQTGVPDLLEPAQSVQRMMSALLTLTPQSGAVFLDHEGRRVPW